MQPRSAGLSDILTAIQEYPRLYQHTAGQRQHLTAFSAPINLYPFPTKRILLTREHLRDHLVPANGEVYIILYIFSYIKRKSVCL